VEFYSFIVIIKCIVPHTIMVKYFVSITIVLLLAVTLESQTLRDQGGVLLGRIDKDGSVRDASGRLMRRIDSDGIVRDASGRLQGQIDARGRLLGRVDPDGSVRDGSGRLIGRAEGVKLHYAIIELS
jgi:hypothetical protein